MQLSLSTLLPIFALIAFGAEAATIPRDLPAPHSNARRSQIAEVQEAALERRNMAQVQASDEERHARVRVKREDGSEVEAEAVEERAPGW